MERKYDFNSNVVYVDPKGIRHSALVTVWWTGGSEVSAYRSSSGEPGCNVVYITSDEAKKDPFGAQLERSTSVVHKSKQPADGNYWCWPDEIV